MAARFVSEISHARTAAIMGLRHKIPISSAAFLTNPSALVMDAGILLAIYPDEQRYGQHHIDQHGCPYRNMKYS